MLLLCEVHSQPFFLPFFLPLGRQFNPFILFNSPYFIPLSFSFILPSLSFNYSLFFFPSILQDNETARRRQLYPETDIGFLRGTSSRFTVPPLSVLQTSSPENGPWLRQKKGRGHHWLRRRITQHHTLSYTGCSSISPSSTRSRHSVSLQQSYSYITEITRSWHLECNFLSCLPRYLVTRCINKARKNETVESTGLVG